MEDHINQLSKDLEEVMGDVKSILYILTGTEHDSTTGLLNRFAEQKIEAATKIQILEKRVDKLEKWKDRIIWAGLGMALPAGYGIVDIIHQFFGIK
jgi:hypothetical protein